MVQSNTISIFVKSQVPDFYNRDGAELVQFIEFYYEWMAQFDNPVFVARKLAEYKDPDLIPDKIFEFMRSEFMKNIPKNVIVDERILIKNILDFYQARGTEKAYKMLFRILFNDETVNFYYPGRDILRASDGKWIIERSLKINKNKTIDIETVNVIRGTNSGASARKDKFLSYIQNEITINELYINNVFGTFEEGEQIIDDFSGEPIGVILTGGIITYPGGWLGTDGFLSSNKYLQDNNFYQEFSYQIRSTHSLVDYEQVAKNLVHPSGTKLFGAVDIINNIDFSDYLNITITATVGDEELDRITLNYQLVIPETPYLGIVSDYSLQEEYTIGTSQIKSLELVKDWYDFQPFSNDFGDVEIAEMEKPQWLISPSFIYVFPNWTPVKIVDPTNSDTLYYFAKRFVNTSVTLISSEYKYGNTNNLTPTFIVIS